MEIRDDRGRPARWLDALDAEPRGWAARLLSPAAAIYAAGAALARVLKPDRPLPDPPFTLGVGNLRVGGTGKTPVTEDLGRRLVAAGHRVAVVTRGYRSAGGGDEPEWLSEKLGVPVIVDASRERALRRAQEQGAEVVLLDDALQTRFRPTKTWALMLERDLEFAPRVLPAGPAREAPPAALARADAWVVRVETPGDLGARIAELRPRAVAQGLGERPLLGVRLTPRCLRDEEGRDHALETASALGPTLLLSGLARPQSFEGDARSAGAQAVASLRWEDHGDPRATEKETVERLIEAHGIQSLLCPEKNRARLERLGLTRPLYCLVSEIEWDVADPLSALGELPPTG